MRALVEVTICVSVDGSVSGRAWRDRIEPALAQGMTTTDAPGSQPAAAPGAVGLERLKRVVRTARVIAASRAQQGAHKQLICPDQGAEDGAHVVATFCQSPARLCRIRVAGAPRAAARAPTMRSAAGNSDWASRKDSRIMRRSRLRATAFPMVFAAIAKPSRGWPRLFGRTVTDRWESWKRRPNR